MYINLSKLDLENVPLVKLGMDMADYTKTYKNECRTLGTTRAQILENACAIETLMMCMRCFQNGRLHG